MSVIDTLGTGFSTINKRLAVVLVPIILDLFFWLGPRLSVEALQLGASFDRLPPDYRSVMQQLVAGFNGFALLGIGIPNLLGSGADVGNMFGAPILEIQGRWPFIAIMIAIAICGLFLTSLYLTLIAQVVREGRLHWHKLYRVLVYWGRLLLLMVVLGVPAVAISLPLGIVILLAASVSASLAMFLAFLSQGPFFLLGFVFVFAAMAIFADDARPLQAIGRGVGVLVRSFWSSLGLGVIALIVFLGFPIIWQMLMHNPYGIIVAIVGNAYIFTGLATATMMFYRDRAARLARGATPTGGTGAR